MPSADSAEETSKHILAWDLLGYLSKKSLTYSLKSLFGGTQRAFPVPRKKRKKEPFDYKSNQCFWDETGSWRGLDKLEFISLSYHHSIAEPF